MPSPLKRLRTHDPRQVGALIIAGILFVGACESTPNKAAATTITTPPESSIQSNSTEAIATAVEFYVTNESVDILDECSKEDNWHYEFLAMLSVAIDADLKNNLAALDAQTANFKQEEYYAKWRAAVESARNSESLRRLIEDSEWWPMINSFPEYWVEFTTDNQILLHTLEDEEQVGTWQISKKQISVSLNSAQQVALLPITTKSYFNNGTAWYFTLTLKAEPDVALPWEGPLVLGPRAGDCGEFNF